MRRRLVSGFSGLTRFLPDFAAATLPTIFRASMGFQSTQSTLTVIASSQPYFPSSLSTVVSACFTLALISFTSTCALGMSFHTKTGRLLWFIIENTTRGLPPTITLDGRQRKDGNVVMCSQISCISSRVM